MTNVHVSVHPLVQTKVAILRDEKTKPKIFRELVGEITQFLMYEATADLPTSPVTVQTPMAAYHGQTLAARIGLIPILRAGLGMVDPILDMIPTAQIWHLGLYRDHETLQPVSYYNKLPADPSVDVCLVLDPMLATGGSASAAVSVLKRWGVRHIKFVGLIAAPEGVALMQREHPDVPLHLAAVDERLNDIGYIIPGLGDAGDRQFGTR
ncbi:MAG: uracil phosphoribosyltransferase [Chloroflexi bacterium]|jgi:uracil phosphoribosyltransferase|nr:MAG: uracil phosphoribosyltransferase [Chloroflexota bacterium]RLT31065.1 MAG: uracil phosphoribosyltransferase [Chloroflexota bacterium]